MVFTKLTDIQKQNLFELKQTLPPSTISSMRALIMRGASVEEAKKSVEERQKAKQEYLDQMDKEIESMKASEPKAKKSKGKAPAPAPAPPPTPEPEAAPKPKAKRAPKKVAIEAAPVQEVVMDTEEPPKPKKGRGRHPIESNVIAITV